MFNEEKILASIPVKHKNAMSIAIAFPNTYEIGMASLGYQTAWKLFNQSPEISASRWFTNIKSDSMSPPEYIGFAFSWELDYKNIFSMLEENNIPLHTKDRKENDPLIFCGGQIPNANPEPFVENFDFFLIGDLEVTVEPFLNKVTELSNLKRKEKLIELSKLPGVYVPNISTNIKRQSFKGELTYSSVLTPNCVWPDTFIVEVVRSCPELCRFCLASYGSLPFRTPSAKESLIPIIDFGLKHTNKIGLLGASVTQHGEFETLLEHLCSINGATAPRSHGALHVQIASIRADTVTKTLSEGLHKLGIKSLTMAVETGSQRLRDFINKKVSSETVFNSIQTIYNAGFNSIKLYGMVGLPTETDDDIQETISFLKNIKSSVNSRTLAPGRPRTLNITWGCSVFVPKATTPFQWYGVDPKSKEKLKLLKKELHKIGVDFRDESYDWALIQAFISRGDRSINIILEKAYRYGSTLGSFKKAIREHKEIDFDYFVFKSWDKSTKLPWESIQGHLNTDIIKKHSEALVGF